VRHLSDGALRRLYDEPYALDEETRAHYNGCQKCQMQFTVVADDARQAGGLMAVPTATVDPVGALARVKARTREKTTPRLSGVTVLRGSWRRPVVGGLAAAIVAIGLVATTTLTPLGANLIQIFQPSKIQPVSIQQGDLTGLDAFASWGDVKWARTPELKEAGSAVEAAQISGLPAIHVDTRKLPTGLAGAPVAYAAVGQSSGSVTFNGNAPSRLNGSTLTVVVGPAETAVYGDLTKLARSAGTSGSAGAEGIKPEGGSGSGGPTADNVKNALAAAGPIMAIAEMRAPRVSSTGASVANIKNALLAQPGLSPTVRAAIKSIDDPKGTLPLPIPSGYVNAHTVKVQNVDGTALGDNTGLGAAVIWIKNGRVYGVAGTVTETELLAVANSLS
jgi:hypothetical protein